MLTTNKIELRDLFIKLGVRKGDTILIHTSLLTLGKLKGGLKTFHNVLLKLVSKKGNIIVPTFTYSFRRNKVFNVKKSKSCKSIGIYPEYVRNLKNSIRSEDPLFSMSCIGPDAKESHEKRNQLFFWKKIDF